MLSLSASAQQIVFTSRTPLDCPLTIGTIENSKDTGFQFVTLRNDSRQPLLAGTLSVSLLSDSGEETVETAAFLLDLQPGESKRVELGMGKIRDITEKIHAAQSRTARAILFVDSIDYSDGERWVVGQPPNRKDVTSDP